MECGGSPRRAFRGVRESHLPNCPDLYTSLLSPLPATHGPLQFLYQTSHHEGVALPRPASCRILLLTRSSKFSSTPLHWPFSSPLITTPSLSTARASLEWSPPASIRSSHARA
eukprot:EG_transcript_49514